MPAKFGKVGVGAVKKAAKTQPGEGGPEDDHLTEEDQYALYREYMAMLTLLFIFSGCNTSWCDCMTVMTEAFRDRHDVEYPRDDKCLETQRVFEQYIQSPFGQARWGDCTDLATDGFTAYADLDASSDRVFKKGARAFIGALEFYVFYVVYEGQRCPYPLWQAFGQYRGRPRTWMQANTAMKRLIVDPAVSIRNLPLEEGGSVQFELDILTAADAGGASASASGSRGTISRAA